MRLTDPRFLGDRWHKSFNYFIKTTAGDLSVDENVDKMVEACFSRKNMAGLDSTFWRFENINAVKNPELKLEISRKIKKSNRSLGAIARVFVEEITRFEGYERPCVKFPVDVGHVAQLAKWFPDCKIIHITRDPRAMAMSKTNDPAGTAMKVRKHPRFSWVIRKAMVMFEIAQYRLTAKLHSQFKNLENYRLFRYEDLLAEPEKTLRDLCQFIEVDFTENMLAPQKGQHEHQPSSLTGKQQKAFDATAATRWQSVIPAIDKWLITTLTKGSMQKLEYDPDTHPIFRVNRQSSPSLCEETA